MIRNIKSALVLLAAAILLAAFGNATTQIPEQSDYQPIPISTLHGPQSDLWAWDYAYVVVDGSERSQSANQNMRRFSPRPGNGTWNQDGAASVGIQPYHALALRASAPLVYGDKPCGLQGVISLRRLRV